MQRHGLRLLDSERDDPPAPAAGLARRVCKVDSKRRASENAANDLALHADAFAVNDANARTAARVSFGEIIFDDGAHLFGWDRMQVEHVTKRNDHRIGK